MDEFEIEWLSDESDECEICGVSYADGARVTLNGEFFLQLLPVASCTGEESYTQSDVYNQILDKLGYKVCEVY